MPLLVDASYDPATEVAKSTAALQAMTALDTTNLRATFTAPASGAVLIVMRCNITGATTYPQILLGVMNGATILKRFPTSQTQGGTAVTSTMLTCEAIGTITGLTPGTSYSLDAAYDVEVLVASTAIRYGGPNDTTTNNARGAFTYMVFSA